MPSILKPLFALLNSPTNRILRLRFPGDNGPAAELLPERLEAFESLSKDFQFNITLLSENASIAAKDLIGKLVTIELVRNDGSLRYFNGYVFEFERSSTNGGIATYRMHLGPWMAFLRLRQDTFIFHDKTVADQTADIFSDYEVRDYKLQVSGPDPQLTQPMQWQETDYNYLHRRWEDLGWYYWYEHREDGHTLVIGDDSLASLEIDGGPLVRYHDGGGPEDEDAIREWSPARRLAPTHYAVTSFDFKNPRPLTATTNTINEQGDVPAIEVYEHLGAYGFKTTTDGEAIAKRRMEEIEAQSKHFDAQSNCRRMQPGRCFTLVEHYDHGVWDDRNFIVTSVTHEARNNYLDDKTERSHYSNRFACLRSKIPWHPGRDFNSRTPRIDGLQTAIVVGPPGEEIHCDEYGRVRCQFHYDREGQYDDKASCLVRVATPMAGERFGFVAIPRIGQEVIVQFLGGNPDRPLITGLVPNEDNMPPWELPANKTQTGFLTRSTQGGGYDNANAIRFEDKIGQEQLWIHAEKDQDVEVENDETHWVGRDRKKTIDRDENVYVKRDRTEVVDRNETITVHNDRTERVDHNERISIGDNRTEDVGKNETLSIGANRTKTVGQSERCSIGKNKTVTIGRFKTESTGMASLENVGLGKMSNVGLGYSRNVGMMMISMIGLNRTDKIGKAWSMSAGEKIELQVGSSRLTLTPDAIYLSAKDIHLKAENEVHVDGPKDVHLNTGSAQPAPEFSGLGSIPLSGAGAIAGFAGAGGVGKGHQRVAEVNAKRTSPDGTTSSVLDRPIAPAPASDPPTANTGLGNDVDALVAQSPSLLGDLDALGQQGWSVDYGTAGAGSYANRQTKSIVLDGNLKGHAAQATQVLAHEVGHATYPYVADLSSKAAYVQGTLADEGAATLNNILVQKEIIAASGPDIGIAGSNSNHAAYIKAHDEYIKTGDAAAARNAIGTQFGQGEKTSTTNQSYEDYYGSWYDSYKNGGK